MVVLVDQMIELNTGESAKRLAIPWVSKRSALRRRIRSETPVSRARTAGVRPKRTIPANIRPPMSWPGAFRSFAKALATDVAAVQAVLTLPWSNGPVEGQITKLKLLKRGAYGRMKLDLLRQRLLHAA